MMSCSCSNFAVSSAMLPLGPFKARVVCVRPTHIGLSFWKTCCRWSIFLSEVVDEPAASRLLAKLLKVEAWNGTREIDKQHTVHGRTNDNAAGPQYTKIVVRGSIYKHFRVLGRLESRWCLRRERCLPKFNTPGDHSATPSSITLQHFHLRDHMPALIILALRRSHILSSHP